MDGQLRMTGALALADIPIPPGPLAGLLMAARDHLCEMGAAAGCVWRINPDMGELLAINRAAVTDGSWEPVLPAANPLCRRLGADNAYFVQGMDGAGTVTVQAGLLYDCTERSIGERFADLSVHYDDPATDAPAGEWCTVTSATMLDTRGRICWTNAGWTRPDARARRGLFKLAQRVNKLAAWLRWRPDAFMSVVDPHIVPVWKETSMGPRYIDPTPGLIYRQDGVGDLPMHFVRFSRAQFLGDLASLALDGRAMAA